MFSKLKRCGCAMWSCLFLASLIVLFGCGESGGFTGGFAGGDGDAVAEADSEDSESLPGIPDLERAAVFVLFGDGLSQHLEQRILSLIEGGARRRVRHVDSLPSTVPPGSLILSIGSRDTTQEIIPSDEMAALGSEGFVVRSGQLEGVPIVATDGNGILPDPFGHPNLGLGFGAFALLEAIGFSFLHPLEPLIPNGLKLNGIEVEIKQSPHWPIRGLHIHTMHPLELTNLLNGWGVEGPEDAAGFEQMIPEWERVLEWALANRLNRLQWVLLMAEEWAEFADSERRQNRLQRLVDIGHEYGLLIGVDVPIALQQQHAFRLIRNPGDLEDELAEMRRHIDWLMEAGFDFLASENGTSEFTNSGADRLLAWMDELARHLDEAHGGKRAYMKIHCTQGQTAEGYLDPETGDLINSNFLSYYADERLAILPHTVQLYSLDDPAPTYDNTDFGFIRDYLQLEVGRREVVWHPESAYWVSYDIDVPLFLPLYAERRFYDLRLLARDELAGRMGRGEHAGKTMDGQMVFSSGWEWGYWLGDVVAARTAWNPRTALSDDGAAFREILKEIFVPFGPARDEMVDILQRLSHIQHSTLIKGDFGKGLPRDIVDRSGIAYIQGFEPWDDISNLVSSLSQLGIPLSMTQPSRRGMVDMRDLTDRSPAYSAEIEPLLAKMSQEFGKIFGELVQLKHQIPPVAEPLYAELVDAAEITSLRAKQIHGLYDYVDGFGDFPFNSGRRERLEEARNALDRAREIVGKREQSYRVSPKRIASWRPNPTVYDFSYLWTVHSLYYWWRDEGKAVDAPRSPCYLNIMDALKVAFGDAPLGDTLQDVLDVLELIPGIGNIANCTNPPSSEPQYPQDNLRSRP